MQPYCGCYSTATFVHAAYSALAPSMLVTMLPAMLAQVALSNEQVTNTMLMQPNTSP